MKKSKNTQGDKLAKLDKSEYYEKLAALQIELNEVARWLQHTGKRLVVVFEGRDTAGKGGAIAAMADALNPRQCRTVALAKPSEIEKTQWYFQRYVPHMPGAGEIVLFDRSWYNRAGVERVMGFCTPEQTKAFLKQAPVFEKMLVDDGILLFKYWLTVDQEQQEQRFAERVADPLKRWKYHCVFSSSLGLANATVRHWRGFNVSAIAAMAPPLPAVSRPSNTTTRRLPVCCNQRATSLSSSCNAASFS
jgi:polyphosphate kinase 2